MKTREFLLNNGIYPNMCGYRYLITAVQIVKENIKQNANKKILFTKELYPQVAKICNTTPSKVERGIRHCISKIGPTQFKKYNIKPYPTNSELVCYLATKEDNN